METKEAILATISELSKEENFSAESNDKKADSANENALDSTEKAVESNIFIDIKEEVEDIQKSDLGDEVALLLRLKEKSLVLFEGLKGAQNRDEGEVLAMKVEMVISYLEYQLFEIEERLEQLKGE